MYVHGSIVYVHGSIVYVHGSIVYVHGTNIVYEHDLKKKYFVFWP